MGYDRFIFTGYARCPKCRTGLIMVDNEPVCCPVCELKKCEDIRSLERESHISQIIY
ncbi:MAG: hypothetical protein ACXAEX_05630 [Promethearchaeota archaeon]|jgi:uncharacterized Zn finger protein (UPF0148 family)